MKIVILSNQISKHGVLTPMLKINEKPILYYVLMHFIYSGYEDFILTVPSNEKTIMEYLISLGKELNMYVMDEKNIYFEKEENKIRVLIIERENEEKTPKTLKFIEKYIGENAFIFTYGDILPTTDIEKTVEFHMENSKIATICAYPINNSEKWVNLGTVVLENEALDYIDENDIDFEKDTLLKIAEDDELAIFKNNCINSKKRKTTFS